ILLSILTYLLFTHIIIYEGLIPSLWNSVNTFGYRTLNCKNIQNSIIQPHHIIIQNRFSFGII
ncbi:unnamed protein product, partial [Musa textilis]